MGKYKPQVPTGNPHGYRYDYSDKSGGCLAIFALLVGFFLLISAPQIFLILGALLAVMWVLFFIFGGIYNWLDYHSISFMEKAYIVLRFFLIPILIPMHILLGMVGVTYIFLLRKGFASFIMTSVLIVSFLIWVPIAFVYVSFRLITKFGNFLTGEITFSYWFSKMNFWAAREMF